MAGDYYLNIIMLISMNIINLHHGADDNNHMAMQGVLQLGVQGATTTSRQLVGLPTDRFTHFIGCLASP